MFSLVTCPTCQPQNGPWHKISKLRIAHQLDLTSCECARWAGKNNKFPNFSFDTLRLSTVQFSSRETHRRLSKTISSPRSTPRSIIHQPDLPRNIAQHTRNAAVETRSVPQLAAHTLSSWWWRHSRSIQTSSPRFHIKTTTNIQACLRRWPVLLRSRYTLPLLCSPSLKMALTCFGCLILI